MGPRAVLIGPPVVLRAVQHGTVDHAPDHDGCNHDDRPRHDDDREVHDDDLAGHDYDRAADDHASGDPADACAVPAEGLQVHGLTCPTTATRRM